MLQSEEEKERKDNFHDELIKRHNNVRIMILTKMQYLLEVKQADNYTEKLYNLASAYGDLGDTPEKPGGGVGGQAVFYVQGNPTPHPMGELKDYYDSGGGDTGDTP